jgi:hypothetical protein
VAGVTEGVCRGSPEPGSTSADRVRMAITDERFEGPRIVDKDRDQQGSFRIRVAFNTSRRLGTAKARWMDDAFVARRRQGVYLAPQLFERADYLQAALTEMRRLYGSFENYAPPALGVTATELEQIRANLLD